MNGRDLALQLGRGQPGIKTLYMSGYTADVIDRDPTGLQKAQGQDFRNFKECRVLAVCKILRKSAQRRYWTFTKPSAGGVKGLDAAEWVRPSSRPEQRNGK